MSLAQMTHALKLRTGNPLRKLVLLKLADNAGDDGECWPSIPHVARECEMSERAVQMHIRFLVERKFLWIEERKTVEGLNKSNIYHLTLDKAQEVQKARKKRKKQTDDSGSGANGAPDGANDAPSKSGATDSPGGANDAGLSGASDAPRTCHSFEPVIEPKEKPSDAEPSSPVLVENYAFSGMVIKLNQADFDRWQKLYDKIELRYELARIDIEFANDKPKSWFNALSAKLSYQNKQALSRIAEANPEANQPHWNDRDQWENEFL